MSDIQFEALNIDLPAIDKKIVREWIENVSATFGKKTGKITYIFTDDPTILDVNRKFLNHDYFTDIITFDYSKRGTISGDMYISLDTVRSNAENIGEDYNKELHRVIIHGILHLCGINDKGPGEREIMERHENEALDMLMK